MVEVEFQKYLKPGNFIKPQKWNFSKILKLSGGLANSFKKFYIKNNHIKKTTTDMRALYILVQC